MCPVPQAPASEAGFQIKRPDRPTSQFPSRSATFSGANPECRLLNEHEVAAWLGISVKTLRNKRVTGDGIPYVKLGGRLVRYLQVDVAAYIAAGARRSTSDVRRRSGMETLPPNK